MDTVCPELAARTTLWVTHAIDIPISPPSLQAPLKPGPQLMRLAPPIAGEPGRVELAGWVALNQATTRFLEVEARGPALITGRLTTSARSIGR